MKLGMPTLIEYESLQQNVNLCYELELDFIELNMNLPIYTPESLDIIDLEDVRNRYGIDFSIHLPEEIDLGSFHPSIRQGHLERCKETVRWASKSNIKTLNMHLNQGVSFTLPDQRVWVNERYEAQFTSLVYESYSELLELANQLNVDICVENTMNFQLPFVERTLNKLMQFDNFYLTWDVGHDGKCGFQEKPFFDKNLSRIRHMHLHDYNGRSDHQALYSGTVPINDRLQLAKELDISVVVEVKTGNSLIESIEKLRNEYGNAKKVRTDD
ncbi:sugar phosphate isomerase/epimerase family protein [Paenibacillus alkalitolerans]|uniref:sugar phosphate isomerase/epimerase family protein n=1 Tax=Paenibacillus alkalitolerans TaxID=2799335 RepID=UPI001F2CA344|nr:sugar phosphate isomerase/epimerase [Paenibacillus alkalitolerans]